MDLTMNYANWAKEHASILSGLSEKRVIVMYSGGKDSSVTLHYFLKASEEFQFCFETHAAIFPQHVFRHESQKTIDSYWKEKGVTIIWHKVPETDEALETAVNADINPCLVCNRVKKNLIIEQLKDTIRNWENLCFVISYSLWDLVSATIEHILSGLYANHNNSGSLREKIVKERFIETSQRFYPTIELKDGVTILKPLIKYNDQDILNVIIRNRIPIVKESCRFKGYRPKRIFANYYQTSDLQFGFEKVFNFAKASLALPDIAYYENIKIRDYITKII